MTPNMNGFFTQLKNLARTIKLSTGEKQNMRVNLYNYLEQNPIGTFAVPASKAFTPVPSMYFFFSPRYMVPIALLLVVGLSGGTAFAAQGAMPGDALYAVKINVNEPVAVALATNSAAKAQVNASIATTRLEEAETLAANGKLDAAATAQLASNFTAHAKAAETNTTDVESNDPGAAAQLGTDFNSTLAAHSAILSQIGDDSKDDATIQNSNSLAIEVQREADHGNHQGTSDSSNASTGVTLAIATAAPATATPSVSNGSRIRTFAAVAPQAATGTATSSGTTSVSAKTKGKSSSNSGNPNDAKIAASLAVQASTSIKAMLQDYAVIEPSLDANTSSQLAAQIAVVQTQYSQGNFAAAIRTAIKLDIYFKAGKTINIKLLSGLLNISGGNGSDNNSGKAPSTPATTTDNSSDNSGKGGPEDQDASGTVNVQLHL
jgi:hypothetical protein